MEKLVQPLQFFLEKNGLKKKLKERLYLHIWPLVAGEKIARYTQPVKIERDRLIVEVSDSIWLYHLTLLKSKIIQDFNSKANEIIIQDIKFINADMTSLQSLRKSNILPQKTNFLRGNFQQLKGIQLKKEETSKIEEIVSAAPDYLQVSMRKLYNNFYKQQIYNKKKGAKQCQRCCRYFFKLKEQLCVYCQQDLNAWQAVLNNFLKLTPWCTYDLLRREHPLLDEQIFKIYKNNLMASSRKCLITLLTKIRSGDDEQKNKLKEIAQNYILLFNEKEPASIQREHIIAALEEFPGLYQLLYSDVSWQ